MLLLTRKQGESLIIEVDGMAEPIEITLVDGGAQAKIGVAAPAKCKIWRKELYQTILSNRQAAARTAAAGTRNLALQLSKQMRAQMLSETKKPAETGEPKSE